MSLEIITDHKWKDFKYGYEVPEKVKKEEYAHLDKDGADYDGWIYYRHCWYHISDFLRLEGNHPFESEWHGYSSDSFFSGVLIKLSKDGEQYKIATYIS